MTLIALDPDQPAADPALPDLRGLVFVTSKWFPSGEAREATSFEELLRRLVLNCSEGSAWVQRPEEQQRQFDKKFPPDATTTFSQRRWVPDSEAGDVINVIGRSIREIYAADLSDAQLAERLEECDCRVFLDRRRLQALKSAPLDDRPGYATAEFRFKRVADWQLCYVTLAVWTHIPLGDTLGPPRAHHPPLPCLTLPQAEQSLQMHRTTTDLFWDIITQQRNESALSNINLQMGRHEFRPPEFLFAVTSSNPQVARLDWLAGKDPQSHVVDELLRWNLHVDNANGDGVAAGVVDNALLVRTFHSDGFQRTPRYLILAPSFHPDRPSELATGEAKMDRLIVDLVELESDAAIRLWDIGTDTTTFSNHVDTYRNVGRRAGALFDAIAFLLPVCRGRRLQEVHLAIDLIHQTLLQGVADLRAVEDRLLELAGDVADAATDLRSRCTDSLHECAAPGHTSISDSLSTAGYFREARAATAAASKRAKRCREVNDDLLDAIGRAVDERRSRETDRLSILSASFTATIAVLAVLTAIDLLWRRDQSGLKIGIVPTVGQIEIAVFAIVVGVLSYAGYVNYRSHRGWSLTSRRYVRRYEGVRQFLRAASTDALSRFARRVNKDGKDDGNDELMEEWNRLDTKLARKLADLLGDLFPRLSSDQIWNDRDDMLPVLLDPPSVHGMFSGRANRKRDIRLLMRRVEEWSLQSLVITERPRVLWVPYLPKLTCIYRFWLYSFTLAGMDADGVHHGGDKAVRWDEFRIAMRNAGFSKEHVKDIDNWGRLSRWKSPGELLDELERLKMRRIPGKDPQKVKEEASRIVEEMRKDLNPLGK